MSIEDRIVAMKFENKAFQAAALATMFTLDQLKQKLGMTGGAKGIQDVQAAAGRFNLNPMGTAVDGISTKFLALSTVAITALSNITNRAIDAGLNLGKSLTIAPISSGFSEYETKMGSIQTILSNTQAAGTNLEDVNSTLQELNEYADKTIYNFGEMARNIGTFTAAGVDLETATGSIKGIANLAALSGSTSAQASTAMYQLSQAISAGRVSLEDWNSVVNAGMGGTVFQRALAQTAEQMGTLKKGSLELVGPMKNVKIEGQSFRNSVTAKPGEVSWLTSDVLTNTLKQLAGEFTNAELKSQGFSDAQIKAIQKQAAMAQDAATQVKTFSQLIDTLRESVGSGWAQTFELLFGNFTEAKTLFTNINNVVGGFVNHTSEARNELVGVWKDLGGREVLINSLGKAFDNLFALLKPIGQAFREVFPPKTAQDLFNLTGRFQAFISKLTPGAELLDQIKRIFAGVFSVLKIGVNLFKAVAGGIGKIFSSASTGSGGFLELAASVGDFLVKLSDVIESSKIFEKVFDTIGSVIGTVVAAIGYLASSIASLFTGGSFTAGSAAMDGLNSASGKLSAAGGTLLNIWEKVLQAFARIGGVFEPIIDAIGVIADKIKGAFSEAFSGASFDTVLDVFNTAFLGGLIFLINKFINGGFTADLTGGLFGSIGETFGQLTETLKSMQANLQAKTLLTIAGAVGILTASIVALSLIDSKNLTKALVAISTGFGVLFGALVAMSKFAGAGGFAKIPVIAASLMTLSTSMLVLSASIAILAGLSWEELSKGLAGVAGGITLLVGAAVVISKYSGGMTRAGIGMIAMAVALNGIALAVRQFGSMDLADIGKGLLAMGTSLLFVTGALAVIPATALLTGPGLIAAAAGIFVLAQALQAFGSMKLSEIGKGLLALTVALTLLTAALIVIPPTAFLTGPGLLAAAAGIAILAEALDKMGGMSVKGIVKGLVALGASLTILSAALIIMSATLSGSAALLVAAVALRVLTPVLERLGAMSLGDIIKSLVALAGALTIIGIAGIALTPAIPTLLTLGVAVAGIGLGIGLAGAGALAFATALGIIATSGIAAIGVLTAFGKAFPEFMTNIAMGLTAFTLTMGAQVAKIVEVVGKIGAGILDVLIKLIPKFGELVTTLIDTFLRIVGEKTAPIVNAAFKMIMSFLNTLRNNIGKIVAIGADLIANFVTAIGNNLGKIVQAAANTIIKFINALAKTIREKKDQLAEAGTNLAGAIVEGMSAALTEAVTTLGNKAASLAKSIINRAKDALKINSPSKVFIGIGNSVGEGLVMGMDAYSNIVGKSSENLAGNAINTVRMTLASIGDAVDTNVNLSPTVTPVLDLTKLANDASQIGGILAINPIDTSVALGNASAIMSDISSLNAQNTARDTPTEPSQVIFQQTNNSPKALDPSTIFINTRSQIALAKEVLAKS